MNKPIYEPAGRAYEYGELAVNIYTGCNHGCSYCYARKQKARWTKKGTPCKFDTPEPRAGIAAAVRRQIEREGMTDKTIFLCFSCDPYPTEIDTTATREVIKAIKETGNHVRILTKGGFRAKRDFDLLDSGDQFGVTFTTDKFFHPSPEEPRAANPEERLATLEEAKRNGIQTWVSCEPVLDPEAVCRLIRCGWYIDLFKIGKLNHAKSSIDWAAFGKRAEALCKANGRNYYIKEDLREEMEREA